MNRLVCGEREFAIIGLEHDEGNYAITIRKDDSFSPDALEGLDRVGVLDEVNAGVFLELKNYDQPEVSEDKKGITIKYTMSTAALSQEAAMAKLERLAAALGIDLSSQES